MKGGFEIRRVQNTYRINQTTSWISLEGSINAQPGQFVMVWLPEIGEKPFSIASIEPFCILIVAVGPFSNELQRLSSGDPIWIKGPLGHGFEIDGEHMILVGGGYGSAPLLPLAKAARAKDLEVLVCLGAQNSASILLQDAFEKSGCRVMVATDDGSRGKKGLVTLIVEQALQETIFDTLYACGPVGMLKALAKICFQHHLDYQLSWEAHMRCGLGLCGSCEVSQSFDPSLPVGWLACYDGPVFKHRWHPKR
jgi:dihydroorotate dehydrogenase electron transfer subunit